MDVVRMQEAMDLSPQFRQLSPGLRVDDEDAGATRGDDQAALLPVTGNLEQPADVRAGGRVRIPKKVEVGEGGMLGVQDVQAGGRPDPFGSLPVLEHVDDRGAGDPVRALPVVLVGLEPHSVETDQPSFRTNPYIVAPVLADPVHLRVGKAGFRQVQAGVLTRRLQESDPQEQGRDA